ncbi:MAG: LptF/LptG family permease [Amphiplicatus sp.]
MSSLDRYLFREGLAAFLAATLVITAIVWTTQTMKYANLIIEHGEGFSALIRISLLILPSLIAIIMPFALFGAAIYSLQRMHSDSEIAVMFASGVGRLRIGAPLILIGFGVALATFWVNIDLMPTAYRKLKAEIAAIHADFASSLLRPGEFTTFDNGYTIYVETARPDARIPGASQFTGVLVNDYTKPGETQTYMAQRGALRKTDSGPVLLLDNGNIQRAKPGAPVEIVRFNETVINAADFMRDSRDDLILEPSERYLGELFHPDPAKQWDRENVGRLIAEGHNRLASPLYAIAYVLIALFALLGGPYNRRGYGTRIAIACAIAGGLRVVGFTAQSMSAATGAYWLQYVPPLAAIAVFGALLAGELRPRQRRAEAS